jgi:GAF domain-containing protein/HAMP domain-containing protein
MQFRKKNSPTSIPSGPKQRSRINPRVLLYGAVGLSGLLAVAFLLWAVIQGELRYFLLAGSFSISFLLGIFAASKVWQASEPIKIFLFTLTLEVSLALLAGIFPSYSGFPYAVIAITIAFLLAAIASRGQVSDWIISLGLLGAIGSVLLTILAPFPQISNQIISIIVISFSIVLALFLLFLFIRGTITATLRVKLIFVALALTLIPLIALSLINNQFLRTSIQQQSNQSLIVAVEQTTSSVDSFFKTNLDSISNESSLSAILDYLKLDPTVRSGSQEESKIMATFQSLQTKQKVFLPSYGLLNLIGVNILDTDRSSVSKSERFTTYFQHTATTGEQFASSVEFVPDTREAYIYFINPILNVNKQTIGFLRVRYDAHVLQTLIQSNVGLIGLRSYPILIDENGLRLADGFSPNLLYRSVSQFSSDKYNELIDSRRIPPYLPQSIIALEQPDFANIIASSRTSDIFATSTIVGQLVISQSGIVKQLEFKPWNVIYVQEQTALIGALNSQNRLSAIISTLIAALVGVLITIVANAFTIPILQLTETAEKISAGDLTLQARVTSSDEIGILGNSFNSMTRQLKEFIDSLEERVQVRTQQLAKQNETLQFRSRQLQTVADVARGVVSSRDFESLLSTVTTLISERFDFYHVGIFLLDEKGENAVLRAANSVGGRKMLDRQHKLQVGQVGIVGYVTDTGEPRIATDVGQDAVFFNNPDLPQTKSEMALPLKVGDKVIGALDVQSIESDAFSQEDIDLFTTLSDQIAIAINNNQLYSDTSKALETSERLHRQYLNQEWTKQTTETSNTSYKFTSDGLVPLKEDLPEIKMVLDSARPISRTQKSKDHSGTINSILAVPILLRGESIGVIHLQETANNDYVWSQNELATVQAVADQVAQTLENARLFEQTIKRADRERKVLDITSKIRSTNDPQKMLEITLEELRRNLSATKAQIVLNLSEPLSQRVDSTQATDISDGNQIPENQPG